MSIYNKNFNINSPEDFERVFNNSKEDAEKISEILGRTYSSIGRAANYLANGDLFKNIYQKSIGFKSCAEVVKGVNSYKVLLRDSIAVCNDVIPPLLISSFKCHQTTLHHYRMGQKNASIATMAETKELAKKIAAEYDKLEKAFRSLTDEEVQRILSLNTDHFSIYTKKRELEERQAEGNKETLYLIQKVEDSLDNAIKSSGCIIVALRNMCRFWNDAERHSEDLAQQANMIQLLINVDVDVESNEPTQEQQDFYKCLETEEKEIAMDRASANSQPKKNLEEVVKTMKTGTRTLADIPPQNSIVELIKFRGIKKEFEESYFGWLALAKVNQEMITSMKEVIVDVEEVQNDILRMEKDPLVIAFHANTFS